MAGMDMNGMDHSKMAGMASACSPLQGSYKLAAGGYMAHQMLRSSRYPADSQATIDAVPDSN